MAKRSTMRDLLWSRWCNTFLGLGLAEATVAAAFARLADAYSEKGRFYHSLDHLHEVLAILDGFRERADSGSVEFAAWFHDVVYDARASENEERSADWAAGMLREFGLSPGTIQRTKELILFTKLHDAPNDDTAAAILLDADLAILGADPTRYAEYTADIRREYCWVPEKDYRGGRTRVLEAFLQRNRIYRTDELFAAREAQARHNLAEEIKRLRQNA